MNYGGPPPISFADCPKKESKHCGPSILPRPTGHCKRYARNIPSDRINPDQITGVRRKMLLPPLSATPKESDIDDEVDEDFRKAAADCMIQRRRNKGKLLKVTTTTTTTTWKNSFRERRAASQAMIRNECFGNAPPSAMPWSGFGKMPPGRYEDPAVTLSKLIDEETEEMESSKIYLEKAHYDEAIVPKSYRELADAYKSKYNKDESLLDSELEPELAAQLLQSEEHGANLKHIPPAALYGRLFPDDKSIPKIMVTAASKRRRGVVIPVRAGMHPDEQLIDDLDAGIVDYYEINYNTPQEAKPMPSPIKHEAEGDADQILGISAESNEAEDEERKPFKYIVTHEPPLHGNYAQLRGSEPPLWFPGFFTINPGLAELQVLEDPSDALEKAWENMNPSKVKSPYGNILLGK